MCEVHITSPPSHRILSEFNLRLEVEGHTKDDTLLVYINSVLFYEGPISNVVRLDNLPLNHNERFVINVAIYNGTSIIATDECGPYKYSNKAEEPLKFTSWGSSKLFTNYVPDSDINTKLFVVVSESSVIDQKVDNLLILPSTKAKTNIKITQGESIYIVNASDNVVRVNNVNVPHSSEVTIVKDSNEWK